MHTINPKVTTKITKATVIANKPTKQVKLNLKKNIQLIQRKTEKEKGNKGLIGQIE